MLVWKASSQSDSSQILHEKYFLQRKQALRKNNYSHCPSVSTCATPFPLRSLSSVHTKRRSSQKPLSLMQAPCRKNGSLSILIFGITWYTSLLKVKGTCEDMSHSNVVGKCKTFVQPWQRQWQANHTLSWSRNKPPWPLSPEAGVHLSAKCQTSGRIPRKHMETRQFFRFRSVCEVFSWLQFEHDRLHVCCELLLNARRTKENGRGRHTKLLFSLLHLAK